LRPIVVDIPFTYGVSTPILVSLLLLVCTDVLVVSCADVGPDVAVFLTAAVSPLGPLL
jgi:hypothetical protein